MPARVSVVVPAYNVAAYLETCLESLAQQTFADLEILVVDDGSTDKTPNIAQRFAARDGRFRVVRQANAGLGAARNTGIDHAEGEFLAFVDGDDVLPQHAYATLLGALDRTCSDFATGNVRRLTSLGTTRATFLGDAFQRERLKTHVTRFPELVVDRLACNKLFRRSFWNRHGFRFPEGVRNEDIPVVIPAHHLAGAVDVVAETVYLWRRRESGDLSGSQRRTGSRALRHRVNAVDHVSRFLAERGMADAKLVYDRSVVGNDLRYFLDVLDQADDDHRRLFLDLVNDFLDRADARALDQPLAIERLKWHLVRRRALPELLEVLRFQAEDLGETPPVRRLRTWYGDYPYRTDRRLRIPRRIYRLEDELALVGRLDDVRWEGETLRIEGHAYVEMIGAPHARSQKIEVVARSADTRRQQVLLHTETVHRPDVTADAAQQLAELAWSGFVATLDVQRLASGGRLRRGSWQIGLVVRAGGIVREGWRLEPAPLRPVPAAEVWLDGARAWAGLTQTGELELRVHRNQSLVRSYRAESDELLLEGDVGSAGDRVKLNVHARESSAALQYVVSVEGSGDRSAFEARVPLGDLVAGPDVAHRAARAEERGEGITWDFSLVGERGRRRLTLAEAAPESTWALDRREVSVRRTRFGNLTVVERSFRPVVRSVEWSAAGHLTLSGSFHAPGGDYELVLRERRGGSHAVPLRCDAEAARFIAEVTPGRVASLAGTRPLPEGRWELFARPAGNARSTEADVLLARELLGELPVSATVGGKLFRLGVAGYDTPVLAIERDLEDDERGGFRQRRLRRGFYAGQRRRELRDVVLYDCFGGREYSDSPRAIHEELVRRDAPFEHLWVVRDGACAVPGSAAAVRELSKRYYDAYASARYVVGNDYWPRWAARRPDQTWLQTWHGAPLKRLGLDLARRPKAIREYRRVLRQRTENWQHVVSPGAFATPILRRAFSVGGEVVETGLPRTDMLLRDDHDRRAEEVRRRLGLSPDQRVVLYAPSYRDHLGTGDGYLPGLLLDLASLRAALDRDDVVLFRKHRRMIGALSEEAEAAIVDVSDYPDATELLLAVDVLVTDYSSAIFDFAVVGRPIVFFTPDFEAYRDEIRGFSIDFEADAPGPLLRTTDEVTDALRNLDAVRAASAGRYERFVAAYCGLSDGLASSRVVDAVFSW
jgi:CDP-glycerol glycerophosphotransferase